MGFLLRSAFWFSGVLLLLPFGEVGDERSVGPVDTFFAAKAALSDVGALCDRQPQACTVGKAALETIGLRARESARVAYDVLDERFGDAAHDCSASRGRSARSDNGDGTTVMGDCAFGEDHWRHFVDFAERRWIVVLPKGVDTDSVRGTLVQQSSGFGDRTLKWTVFGAAGHVPRPESLL